VIVLSSPARLRHIGVAAVGLSAIFIVPQAKAQEALALECLCETLPFLDAATTWRAAAVAGPGGVAESQPAASVESEIEAQRQIIAEQRALIDQQNVMLAEQRQHIVKMQGQLITQQAQIDRLSSFALAEAPLDMFRGTGMGQGVGPGPALPGPGSTAVALPDAPVGEAPPPAEPPEQRVAAVPEGQGVLTRAGQLFFEPSFEYTRSSTNRPGLSRDRADSGNPDRADRGDRCRPRYARRDGVAAVRDIGPARGRGPRPLSLSQRPHRGCPATRRRDRPADCASRGRDRRCRTVAALPVQPAGRAKADLRRLAARQIGHGQGAVRHRL
jgi:uncharacterized coiled-coil protein SlyX